VRVTSAVQHRWREGDPVVGKTVASEDITDCHTCLALRGRKLTSVAFRDAVRTAQ
jgi:hypothetical protein